MPTSAKQDAADGIECLRPAIVRAITSRLVCALLPIALVACSSEDTPSAAPNTSPVREVSYEVFPFVLALDDAARNALRESRDDGTVVFDPAPPILDEVHRGSIVLSGVATNAPLGLLRIVQEVERNGTSLMLRPSA